MQRKGLGRKRELDALKCDGFGSAGSVSEMKINSLGRMAETCPKPAFVKAMNLWHQKMQHHRTMLACHPSFSVSLAFSGKRKRLCMSFSISFAGTGREI